MSEPLHQILLIDSDPSFIQNLKDIGGSLKSKCGFISAFSLEEAKVILEDDKPDMILTNFTLVDGESLNFLQESQVDIPAVIRCSEENQLKLVADLDLDDLVSWPHYDTSLTSLFLFIHQFCMQQSLKKTLNFHERSLAMCRDEIKRLEKEKILQGAGNSITQPQFLQEALRESELMYRTLFENAPVGMCLATIDGNVFGYNDAMRGLIGVSDESELDSFNLHKLFPRAEDYESLLTEMQTVGFIRDIEGQFVNAAGLVFYAILNITLLSIGGEDFLLTVLEDITMRKVAEEKLADYADQLRDANAELYQYAYAVAHDIRAPLRAIRNYADFLYEDLANSLEDEQKEYMDNMVRSVSDAEEFVADLLELSRIGRKEIDSEPIDLGMLIKDLIQSLDLPKEIQIDLPQSWPEVMGERTLLKQIFMNLITNGIKFNRSETKTIQIAWRDLDEKMVEIAVQDNGIGIKPEYHEQIFRVFERLHTKQEYDGTGVGLAIVKKSITKMQGQIELQSEEGKGSIFYIRLLKPSVGDA